ncbi:MAG: OmpA family protein [Paracoccaceae bacterium]
MRADGLLSLLVLWASQVAALDLTLPPNAAQTAARDSVFDSYIAPTSPFLDGGYLTGVMVEGEVRRTAWRIDSPGLTSLQVLAPLRRQLIEDGFEIILDCDQTTCGGFDFRFEVETLPAPAMFVNIRSYRYLTATLGERGAPKEIVTVLSSASATAAHLQIIHAGKIAAQPRVAEADESSPTEPIPGEDASLGARLLSKGHVVLEGLDFAVGAVRLADSESSQLSALADVLKDRPTLRIALVGHTDSIGRLEANIDISRRRAAAVRQRMVDRYDVDPRQIEVGGMGYLAPRASNLTPDGREANRRVEAVILADDE